jgi:phosphoesterase RecJ-like protein
MPDIFDFFERHSSFILTTHAGPDADGLGAELVFARILETMGKEIHILNSDPVPGRFSFLDPENRIGEWLPSRDDSLPEQSALLIVDTSDEYNIGTVKEIMGRVRETFVVDHHEKSPFSSLSGFIDSTASSVCEMAVETAQSAGIVLDKNTATAAYAGISYDSGSFAYIKTTVRTFKAALFLAEAGVVPYFVYGKLNESSSLGALLLQKQVLSSLEIRGKGRIAVQILRKEDLETTGASFEDAESLINIPLKAKDISVSILVKENSEGQVRCSLRSKGTVPVSKIAQFFGGGGHITAAGFRSSAGVDETLEKTLKKVVDLMDKKQ